MKNLSRDELRLFQDEGKHMLSA